MLQSKINCNNTRNKNIKTFRKTNKIPQKFLNRLKTTAQPLIAKL